VTMILDRPERQLLKDFSPSAWEELAFRIRAFAPDVVVLVARKMPRLAECFDLDFGHGPFIVSDLAIPFIHRRLAGARVAIVDDIVNVGSTLRHAQKSAEACSASTTRMFALGARKASATILEGVEYVWPSPLNERDYARFVMQVPTVLHHLRKPYDLEFPILPCRLTAPFRSAHDIHLWLADHYGTHAVRSLSQSSPATGLVRFSLDLPTAGPGNRKLRLYLDTRTGLCYVVPFAIPPRLEMVCPASLAHPFAIGFLKAVMESLDGCPEGAALWREEPATRAFLFAASLDYGLHVLGQLSAILSLSGDVPVSFPDLELLFGPVRADFEGTEAAPTLQPVSAGDWAAEKPESPFYFFLRSPGRGQELLNRLRDRAHSMCGFTLFSEIFDELARSVGASDPQDYLLDWPYSRQEIKEAPYLRLRIGPTFDDLVAIYAALHHADQNGPLPVRNQVSAILDFAIDSGTVVPTIARYEDRLYRVYRKGESEARDRAMDRVLYAWSMFGKPMTLTRFSKINAILAFSSALPQVLAPCSLTHGNVASLQTSVLDLEQAEISKHLQRTGRLRSAGA
jgi:hypothetical protein